jgi:HEAT repeat protein
MKRAVLFASVVAVAVLVCTPLPGDDKPPLRAEALSPLPPEPISRAPVREPTYEGKPLSRWVERLQNCEGQPEQQRAAGVIKTFGPDAKPAVPTLVGLLDDRSEPFRELVGDILCAIGPGCRDAVPTLVASLKDGTARSPAVVAKVLGQIGPDAKEAVPELRKALRSDNPTVRCYAAHGLWRIERETRVVPVLAALLMEKSGQMVIPAAEALAEMGPDARAALPELRKAALSEKSFYVAHAARRAIEKIDPEEAKKIKPPAPPLLLMPVNPHDRLTLPGPDESR